MDKDQGCLIKMCEEPPDGVNMGEEAVGKEGMTEISLHALARTFNPRTLRLQGTIKGKNLTVLIDSGLTHNFIQELVAYKLGVCQQSL